VSDAGSGNAILRLSRRMALLFLHKEFETACFGSFILIPLLNSPESYRAD
jgi:hypothetical protein